MGYGYTFWHITSYSTIPGLRVWLPFGCMYTAQCSYLVMSFCVYCLILSIGYNTKIFLCGINAVHLVLVFVLVFVLSCPHISFQTFNGMLIAIYYNSRRNSNAMYLFANYFTLDYVFEELSIGYFLDQIRRDNVQTNGIHTSENKKQSE